MNYYDNPENIVFIYNHKDALTITRSAGGTWRWQSNVLKCKRHYLDIDDYKILNWLDYLLLGVEIGADIKEVLKQCKIDFGDK